MQFDFNKAEAIKVLEQLAALKTPKNMTVTDFPKQAAFIEDQNSLVAGFCTRRAGKSYAIGLKLCNNALKHPGVSQMYVSLTRESAKRIMVKDVLQVISAKHNLNIKFNKTTLTAVFPNGSEIYLIGMDTNKDEMSKALGQKFKCVVIDEAGAFRQDLFELVYSIIKPACADLRGQILLIGTPSNITKGLFYDVVWAQSVRGWSLHKWTAFDNPFIREQWEAEIKELKEANPRIVETPAFRQNYLGEYVIDASQLVYKFNSARNFIPIAPETKYNVLGVDLGFEDASAFALLGFNPYAKKTYVVETYKQSHMDITNVAERIRYFIQRYNPYKIVIDGAAKQSVEELKRRFSLPLETAEKAGKSDFIEIMNSDLIMGNILISSSMESALPLNERLSTEYENLIWDDRAKNRSEHPNCDNHLADATLYAWRYIYSYLCEEAPKKPTPEEAIEQWMNKQVAKVEQTKYESAWWEA